MQSNVVAEKIHILNLITVKGNIDASSEADITAVAGHEFTYTINRAYNIEEKIMGVMLTVDINATNSDGISLNITGSYTHEFIFKIENLDELSQISKDENGKELIQFEQGLVATILSIAYSTIRGIIFTRTQGTSLGTVILPVINPLLLIENGKVE